jgi:hypothetical protein
MQPNPLRWYSGYTGDGFGEFNENNVLHGRGIEINKYGDINIGYYENGESTGKYIAIHILGDLSVGGW